MSTRVLETSVDSQMRSLSSWLQWPGALKAIERQHWAPILLRNSVYQKTYRNDPVAFVHDCIDWQGRPKGIRSRGWPRSEVRCSAVYSASTTLEGRSTGQHGLATCPRRSGLRFCITLPSLPGRRNLPGRCWRAQRCASSRGPQARGGASVPPHSALRCHGQRHRRRGLASSISLCPWARLPANARK